MLQELPQETRDKAHKLRLMSEGKHNCRSLEELDLAIQFLRYDIADVVVTLLLKEDKNKPNYFLSNQ